MTYYVPGLGEKDPDKTIRSLMQAHENTATNAADIAALQAAGYVVGPASATNNGFVVYDGTTGKLVKNHAATVALASEVSGNLPVANLNSGTSAGATTFWRGDATWTVPVLSSVTNTLGADVNLNDNAFHDGPSCAQGATGIWFASGVVNVLDTGGAASITCKLHDGTNTVASSLGITAGANLTLCVSLSGIFTSPPGNIRISCADSNGVPAGRIKFNASGSSKDSTLTLVRIG
jgi:hypothetical protein